MKETKCKSAAPPRRAGYSYVPPANMRCDAAALVARSFDIAAALCASQVELMHLWAALAYEPSAARSMWFGTWDRPDRRAEARVRRKLLRRWRVPNLQRVAVTDGPRLPLADVTCRVLWRAADEANELIHESIGPEHILLALMYAKHADLVRNTEAYSRECFAVRKQIIALPANRTKPLYGPVRQSMNGGGHIVKTERKRSKRRTAS